MQITNVIVSVILTNGSLAGNAISVQSQIWIHGRSFFDLHILSTGSARGEGARHVAPTLDA
jgi:hypothetical protein